MTIFECQYCEKRYQMNYHYLNHLEIVHNHIEEGTKSKTYQCDLCGNKKYINKKKYDIHMEQYHNNKTQIQQLPQPQPYPQPQTQQIYRCEECDKEFKSQDLYKQHYKILHSSNVKKQKNKNQFKKNEFFDEFDVMIQLERIDSQQPRNRPRQEKIEYLIQYFMNNMIDDQEINDVYEQLNDDFKDKDQKLTIQNIFTDLLL